MAVCLEEFMYPDNEILKLELLVEQVRELRCEYEIRLGDGLIDDCTVVVCGKPVAGYDIESEQPRCLRHLEG
jgi:hypothetical protein